MFDKITSRISKLCCRLNDDFIVPVSLCRVPVSRDGEISMERGEDLSVMSLMWSTCGVWAHLSTVSRCLSIFVANSLLLFVCICALQQVLAVCRAPDQTLPSW